MTDYIPKVEWEAVWSLDILDAFLDVTWASNVFTFCVTKQYATVQANE